MITMKLFSVISLLSSSLYSFFLLNLAAQVSATPFGWKCTSNATYAQNSTYKANLDALLSSLTSTATVPGGFRNATAGAGSAAALYGLFLCRGDVSATDCHDCVAGAASELVQYCPTQRAAVAYYDNCMLRYSDKYFFCVPEAQAAAVAMSNPLNATDSGQIRRAVAELMNKTVVRAAAGDAPGNKFATAEVNVTSFAEAMWAYPAHAGLVY